MAKKLLALKILLPVLVILLVTLLALEIKCLELHDDSGNGILFAIALLLNIIPMIAMIILGIGIVVVSILLFAVNKKLPVVVSALVILCVLIPFVGFSLFVDITALHVYMEVPIVAVVVFAVNIVNVILCSMAISDIKKQKKNTCVDKNQIQ